MTWGIDIAPTTAPAYEWDSWQAADYVLVTPDHLPEECFQISTSARMALTTAIAEIIRDHLASFDRDGEARAFIDASWAFLLPDVDVDVTLPDPPEEKGPGPEPIRIVVTILFDMLRGEGGPDRSLTLAWMDSLARHVLQEADAYDRWFDTVLERLLRNHPEPEVDIFADEFPIGPPVDRDLFDLSVTYRYLPEAPGLRAYLARVAADNPYVLVDED